MDKLLEELGAYELLNNLLPGAIICILLQWQTGFHLPETNVVGDLCIFYFMGLVVDRLGSLLVEPIYKKLNIISKGAYEDFIQASQADPKIDTLSTKSNMYRTFSTVFIVSITYIIIEFFISQTNVRCLILKLFISTILLVLFSYSYRKQSRYIQKRIDRQISCHR